MMRIDHTHVAECHHEATFRLHGKQAIVQLCVPVLEVRFCVATCGSGASAWFKELDAAGTVLTVPTIAEAWGGATADEAKAMVRSVEADGRHIVVKGKTYEMHHAAGTLSIVEVHLEGGKVKEFAAEVKV